MFVFYILQFFRTQPCSIAAVLWSMDRDGRKFNVQTCARDNCLDKRRRREKETQAFAISDN
jgi:hypothetical protein